MESELYPLLLSERLSRVTVYERSDVKHIPRGSEVVWLYNADVLMHFVLKDDSPYRFGYMVVHNKNGLQGVYDIDSDRLKVAIEYEDIKLFANIAELSKVGTNYEMVDLDTNEKIEAYQKRSKINPSKLDMEDYVPLFPTPQDAQDLIKMGLWGAKVGVLEVPSHYRSVTDDTTGVIRWDYPVSGDIFDMSVELPVQFKKRDGEFVTVGIKYEYIILEDRTILNGVELPQENDKTQSFPVWLKIKREEFDDVNISNNSVDEIIALSSDEFNELISLLGDNDIGMLITYLKTLDKIELAEFFLYLEDVKLKENVKAPSAKEQFMKSLESIDADAISDKNKKRATLELPLFINYAKTMYHQALKLKELLDTKYYPYQEGDAAIQFEGYLFITLYSEPMKFVPDYFNQILVQFRDYYDEHNKEHQKIALHLARRFGLLVNSLHVIQKYQDEPYDGLEWFLSTFVEEIKKVDGEVVLEDDAVLFWTMNVFASIIKEDDNSYIASMIELTKELMQFYPYLSESFLYAFQELMKSVTLKEISVENANKFLEIFEELPKLYDKLSYTKIMELKEMIDTVLANEKPQNNKVFEQEGVKSKMILLNYLLDAEDL